MTIARQMGQNQSLDEVIHREMLVEAPEVPPRIRDKRKDPAEETGGRGGEKPDQTADNPREFDIPEGKEVV